MSYTPLSTSLTTMAADLQALAHTIAPQFPELAASIICHAARTGLASLAATSLERELKRHQHALSEIHADAAEEAAQAETPATSITLQAMRRRHAHAKTIADILAPVLPRHPQ